VSWLAANLVWASATMLLVLAVRRPVARLFGAGAAYALWLLPATRLLLPPMPAFDTVVAGLVPPIDTIIALDATSPASAVGSPWPWLQGLAVLWAIGGGAFLVWQWLGYRRFLTGLSLTSRSVGGHEGLPLIESTVVQGPIALGLLDRRIVVPADFSRRYSADEQRLALRHEAIHHHRGDLWCNFAGLLVLALNWFNPIAWIAFRAFREDQELACDAAVAAAEAPAAREDYARALIKSASRPGLIAACPLNHVDQLKRRLQMMKDHRTSRLRMLGGAAAITLLAGVSASFGSAGLAHPHPDSDAKQRRTERIIIMDQKGDHPQGDAERRTRERVLTIRRGENGEVELPEACGESERLVDSSEGEDNNRTRVVMCTRGEADAGTRLERLQRARERLSTMEALDDEHRARVLATIDREIARLRGQ
jgi:beta-lactamase regulating signal transducer with metallopeptidase domain